MLEDIKKDLSLRIYLSGSVGFKKEGYTFNLHKEHPEAPKSLVYVSLRDVVRDFEMRNIIAKLMAPFILDLKPNRLIDLPQSITPLVSTLSDMTGINMISLRSEALKGTVKDHGLGNIIDGKYKEGDVGSIVDDLISSFAHTKFKAIPLIRRAGIILSPYIHVIVDREEGGREKLEKEGFKVKSIMGLQSDILKSCFEANLISEKVLQMSIDNAAAAKAYSMSN